MSRWFRHYAGMMRDEKLVRVALRAKQPIERVVWVWGAILESASEINDGGRFDLEACEIAHFLRADEADIISILLQLEELGRVRENSVVKWGDRQFQSDSSADRQRRYREKQGQNQKPDVHDSGCDGQITSRDGEVTATSRPSDAPETETETETEKKGIRRVPRLSDDDFSKFKAKYPRRSGANPWKPARIALEAAIARGALMVEILAALDAGVGFQRDKIGSEFIPQAVKWVRDERWKDGAASSGPADERYEPTPGQWREHVAFFSNVGRWPRDLGPDPTSPSCRAPPEILAEFGYRERAA